LRTIVYICEPKFREGFGIMSLFRIDNINDIARNVLLLVPSPTPLSPSSR
jgi:hypothetical protein